MSVILVFLLVIACISGWWLAHQRLMSKPWLEQGLPAATPNNAADEIPTAKIGVAVFLAVVGCLFALFASAYFMRMELSDWQAPPLPTLLWFNTAILVLSSAILQIAVAASRQGKLGTTRILLLLVELAGITFLAGQVVVWRELSASGYFLNANPANSFFYLLTGMHGLHIIGGLIAIGHATAEMWSEKTDSKKPAPVQTIELCAMYWHFLLFIWLGLFILLAGWAGDFIAICRQILT